MNTVRLALTHFGMLLLLLAMGILFISPPACAEDWRTPRVQENILRTAPRDDAPFVQIVKPAGGEPKMEVLSRRGDWEEVRLHYRFKFNGSTKPEICALSLFEGTFTGFRKISASTPTRP